MLVLDLSANGVVETSDILGDMHWLGANKDGVIDASDPAFAAIKLCVDVNLEGTLEAGEDRNLPERNRSCYAIDSCSRNCHERRSHLLFQRANENLW